MPLYDYRCNHCRRKVTLFYKTYSDYDAAVPVCPHCQGASLRRVIGRVALTKSEDARMDSLADDSALADLDENDPRSLGRFMRKMSREMSEDLGDEFGEVVDRLEKGESPEEIEKSMPGLGDGEGLDGGDDFA